jgi:hypothetical protein
MSDNSLNTSDLKAALGDPKFIAAHSFEILQSLCCLSDIKDQEEAQDMLLRALEVRECFTCGQEILDGLTRKFGLFPYLTPETLSLPDQIAYEVHRPENMDPEINFHRPQAEVYWTILGGENVVLSAPTSFGKSLIIDAVVASGRFKNILVVVPTIALIDETRKRLAKRFHGQFKVITHGSQAKAGRNIFIATQERVLHDSFDSDVDFFVIDEFYKLSPGRGEDDRSSLLNQVVYRLLKKKRQFYMLGPNVQGVSPDFARQFKYRLFLQPYRTVVSELRNVEGDGDEFDKLLNLCNTLTEPTLIFCRSPSRVREVATRLVAAGLIIKSALGQVAADWVSEHYHSEWHFAKALRLGIGIHHGRIPRALAQFVVHAFDAGEIRFLICTSTLIEGVNTKAKNIIIFDHVIDRKPIDLFTFNNIRGRAGRMKEHFVGHVYLFHPEPEQQLPFVDMPVFTQGEDAPESLLIQIDDNDLTKDSQDRMKNFLSQDVLDYATLKANIGLDPQRQLNLAREIKANLKLYAGILQWDGLPTAFQVQQICQLLWRHFDGRGLGRGSVRSDKHLAYLINSLRSAPTIKSMIDREVSYWGADMAVQMTLDFLRLWANFHFPRLLRGLDRIQKDLFRRAGQEPGDYDYFANRVENYFLDPGIVALDEYGIPLEVARKLQNVLACEGNLDGTLAKLNLLDVERTNLTRFEKAVVEEAQSNL